MSNKETATETSEVQELKLEIERLTALIAVKDAALAPFADAANDVKKSHPDQPFFVITEGFPPYHRVRLCDGTGKDLTVNHLRAAAEALAKGKRDEP